MDDKAVFPPEYFARQDETEDEYFYSVPRKVVHIDGPAIQALTGLYADLIPAESAVLDLMSSWRSHLPEADQLPLRRVAALGMNYDEMIDNPRLVDQDIWVQNLNLNPNLPYAPEEFDVALCAVSVQYLVHPFDVFAEVYRTLKPGGRFILSFSNRCFPSKATAIWLASTDVQRIQLVSLYFKESADWGDAKVRFKNADSGAPVSEDPLYMIWADKPA